MAQSVKNEALPGSATANTHRVTFFILLIDSDIIEQGKFPLQIEIRDYLIIRRDTAGRRKSPPPDNGVRVAS